MIGLGWAGLLLGLSAADGRSTLTQLTMRSRIVMRVQTAVAPPPIVKLEEKKGPRCVAVADLQGAAVIADKGVDFILRGGSRVRARFSSSCPALDYYSGFYIAPTEDRMICADRDVIRSRAGGECAITRFRALVPAGPSLIRRIVGGKSSKP